MSSMYKIFYAMLVAGAIGGAVFAFFARGFMGTGVGFGVFIAASAGVGVVLGFINYIFVKWVLRIFVNKFFTLERVLVGTEPEPLPNVFLSNEIDEMEKSMVRITGEFNKLKSGRSDRRSSGARRSTVETLP